MGAGSSESKAILQDPFGNYFFSFELDGTEVAHFQEFSGIKTSSEIFEIQEGGRNGHTVKRPGQAKFENIVLKYATSVSLALVAWRDECLRDKYVPRDCSVTVHNNGRQELRRYNFKGAWPVSWEGPSLSSSGSDLAVETLELAFESLNIQEFSDTDPDRTEAGSTT